jgi:uncharacterized protein
MNAAATVSVIVACSPAAGQVQQVGLVLPAGSTVSDALRASGLLQRYPQLQGLPAGVWGRKQEPDVLLRDDDRVEIYRPLLCDPKEARRLRYKQKAQRDAQRRLLKAGGAAQPKPAVG